MNLLMRPYEEMRREWIVEQEQQVCRALLPDCSRLPFLQPVGGSVGPPASLGLAGPTYRRQIPPPCRPAKRSPRVCDPTFLRRSTFRRCRQLFRLAIHDLNSLDFLEDEPCTHRPSA